ncbi:MAG TPA: NlpC/P60 family protein [Hyphomonadaceae bacterium]|nr:NlpC/P60 family protein [Hyphomonadaceae bacterium]
MSLSREEIVAEARGWLGTPYRHQASVRGVGADCLGLVRGVWRGVLGAEPEKPPSYTPNWADMGEDTLFEAARRRLVEVAIGAAKPGDVLLFRMGLGAPAKHAAIITAPGKTIHAYWGRAVVETQLVPWWSRRIAGAFQFPGVED